MTHTTKNRRILFILTSKGVFDKVPYERLYITNSNSLLWPGASKWRIYYHRMFSQLSTTCSNLLKYPKMELLVAIDHNQLQTMAAETVDPIDWSHAHLHGQYPLSSTYCTVITLPTNHKTCCSKRGSNTRPRVCQTNALPVRPLGVYYWQIRRFLSKD